MHFFCTNLGCRAYIPEVAVECPDYGNGFSSRLAKKAGNYFVHIPIADQIKDLSESDIIENNMLPQIPSGLKDVVNGSVYKINPVLRQDLSAISITSNFDGVPIHKSSNASVRRLTHSRHY